MTSNCSKPLSSLILALFVLSTIPVSLMGQRDISREILVYFNAGVERQAPDMAAQLSDPNVLELLRLYGMQKSDVVPAFPRFSESDTIATNADGRQTDYIPLSIDR